MSDLSKTAVDYSGEPLWPMPETVTTSCPFCGNVFTSQKEVACCPACGLRLKICYCEYHDEEGGCRQ